MVSALEIGTRRVGPQHPCFIIAEAGVNHNGNLELARQLIDVAVRAGADAVKFQTFKAERIAVPDAPKAKYQLYATDGSESQLEMLRRLELSEGAHKELSAYCQRREILFMSAPFDEESADFLAELGVLVFKIPSGELTNLPFLRHVALHSKPMIISTGMSTLDEVQEAVRTVRDVNNKSLALLHCVSSYPADPSDANLRAMLTMASAFDAPVGYSDHTQGIEVSLAAVALGACIIEKHFTLSRTLPGPDHRVSLEPDELTRLVRSIRIVESSLGDGRKRPMTSEKEIAAVARKSLVAARDIPAGSQLTQGSVAVKRPGTGLPPSMLGQVLGKIAKRNISKGTLLTLEMLR